MSSVAPALSDAVMFIDPLASLNVVWLTTNSAAGKMSSVLQDTKNNTKHKKLSVLNKRLRFIC
jgi:hypothetical protein